jgi:hypothetical protein
VCLRLARICTGGDEVFEDGASSSECALSCGEGGVEGRCADGGGCSITPTPSLFAEPSRPIAIGIVVAVSSHDVGASFTCAFEVKLTVNSGKWSGRDRVTCKAGIPSTRCKYWIFKDH